MLKEQKNSKKQGDVGLGSAIAWFTKNGHTVSIPLTDSQDYDLVVDINNELKKVQVKTTYHKSKHNIYKVNLRVFGGNKSRSTVKKFNNKSIDFIFAVTEMNTKYLIPCFEIESKNTLFLGVKTKKYIVD